MRGGGDAKEQYHIIIRKNFVPLEILEDNADMKRAWDSIRENIKILAHESLGYRESKHHKQSFDEKCSELVD
jgi:hypothetical protein